jgi:hypothetical protein
VPKRIGTSCENSVVKTMNMTRRTLYPIHGEEVTNWSGTTYWNENAKIFQNTEIFL